MADSFYTRAGSGTGPDGVFVATELTRGPWDPDAQHAGPPSALLARETERCGPADGKQVARITLEILRPVPLGRFEAKAEVVRPGRRVELVEGVLSDGDQELIRARAWRIRTEELELPEGPTPGLSGGEPPPGPDEGERKELPATARIGYWKAMDYRFVYGAFMEPGPALVWLRMRVPLVEGEEPSPLVRVITAADAGNGVSSALDWRKWMFINTDLTVHLHRMPADEWVCLDSATMIEPNGIGMSDTLLSDEGGPIGRAVQSLLVGRR